MARSSAPIAGFLALALAGAGCRQSQPDRAAAQLTATSLRAMSCNVRYGTADDGPDGWPLRRARLATAIAAADPEVLGVQEALDFQLEALATLLPDHVRIGVGRDGGARGEHAALFIDSRAWRILEHGDFWLSETPATVASIGWDAALPRICTWARLESCATGESITVWNAHFDHRGERARLESARLIAQRIATATGPRLLLGDLNCGEASAPLVVLRAAGLRDTFRDVHPAATAVGTFHAFRGGTTGEKIDYVLASTGVRTLGAELLTAPAADGRWPSDHHFVMATVEF